MTAKAVTDDRKENKPTPEEVETYMKREGELRKRFMKGSLINGAVLDGLQVLTEASFGFINCNTQPDIPSWADREKPILKHDPRGYIDPARIVATDVFLDGEDVLEGEEYMTRALKLDSMNACAFDFYAKPENWKYLPKDVDVLVFPKTEFRDSSGDRCVGYLYRSGSEWNRHCGCVDFRFDRDCRVAALASPQISTT